MSDPEHVVRLEAFVRDEPKALWGRLFGAMDRSPGGHWSIECSYLGESIYAATLLVGPVSLDDLSISAILSGRYCEAAFHIITEQGSMEAELPTETEKEELAAILKGYR